VLGSVECVYEEVGWEAGAPLIGARSVERDAVNGLPRLLRDGLHFTPEGNRVLHEALMSLIADTWPDQMPDSLPFVLPRWDDEALGKSYNCPK